MDDIINFIQEKIIVFSIIGVLLLIFIYSLLAVTLNKLNRAMYGKTTWMAWVPVFNFYLLGKLTIHFIFGIILVIGLVFAVNIDVTVNGVVTNYSLLPRSIQDPLIIIYGSIVIILYIFAHFKYKNLVARGEAKNEITDTVVGKNPELNKPFFENKKDEETMVNKEENVTTKEEPEKTTETDNEMNDFYHTNNNGSSTNNVSSVKISLSSLNHHDDNNDN